MQAGRQVLEQELQAMRAPARDLDQMVVVEDQQHFILTGLAG